MCDQCEVLYINGVKCHEHGCPNAWKDHKRECKWCGQTFVPQYAEQKCCDKSCLHAYLGIDDPEDEETE